MLKARLCLGQGRFLAHTELHAASTRFLGREYRTITTQLINCDFGLGRYSLKDQMVSNEVYKVVLGQLEEAISTLRLEGL